MITPRPAPPGWSPDEDLGRTFTEDKIDAGHDPTDPAPDELE